MCARGRAAIGSSDACCRRASPDRTFETQVTERGIKLGRFPFFIIFYLRGWIGDGMVKWCPSMWRRRHCAGLDSEHVDVPIPACTGMSQKGERGL